MRNPAAGRESRTGDEDLHFAKILVEKGHVTPAQIAECLRIRTEQTKIPGVRPLRLGDILIKKGYVSMAAIEEIVRNRTTIKSGESSGANPLPTVDLGNAPAEAKQALQDPKRRFGKYALIREVGRGGMGQVFRAWDSDLDRIVAIKFLSGDTADDDVARFLREAKTAASLSHPHIAAQYEAGTIDKRHYIAMQYIEGKSAADLKVSALRAAQIVRDVALAVEHAHRAKIIHRDIKPQNILLDRTGRPYIMDFGIAKSMRGRSQVTQAGTILGTPSYMSPEQADGRPLTARADVYSLGATLYELLTGRPPFKGETPLDTVRRVIHEEPVRPRKLAPALAAGLETIVLKAMEKEPAQRYPSAQALADDLDRFIEGREVLARGPSLMRVAVKQARRNRAAVAIGVAVAVVLTALAGVGISNARQRGRFNEALAEADRDYRAGRWQAAMTAYARAGELDPADTQPRARIAECRKKLAALAEAERLAREDSERNRLESERLKLEAERLKAEEERRRIEADRLRAEVEAAAKRRTEAGPEIEKGKAILEQAERDLYRPGADLAVSRRKALEAIALFDRALALAERHPDALYYRGRAHLLRLDPEKAEADFSVAIDADPGYSPARVARGRLHVGRWVDAGIDSGGLGSLKGKTKAAAEIHLVKAAADFDAAMEEGHLDQREAFDAMLRFARLDLAGCIGACDRAIARNATDEELHKLKGDAILFGSGFDIYQRIDERGAKLLLQGLACYDKAISLRTNFVEARVMRGVARRILGRMSEAVEDLDAALRIDRQSFLALILRALTGPVDGATEASRQEAVELYTRALKIRPQSFFARLNRGAVLGELGRHEESMKDLDAAIAVNPDHGWGWYLKGALLGREGRNAEAERMLTKAIEMDPTNVSAWYNRGAVRANLRRNEEAIADMEQAIKLGHPEPAKVRALIEKIRQR